ncbi:MAG TPA: glycosyltransferase N-terminal domain-containing protein [Longimicrobiales bacterium]|nr:glycosyltransferase N-terminal domain-containing protein [Longimicrobiales bacterium]
MSRLPLPNVLDLVYGAGLTVASPVLAWKLARTGKWRSDWKGRMGRVEALGHDPRPTVLLHGVSVGEVAAAEPLVHRLGGADGRGPCRVAMSVTTNTGFARAEALYGAHHRVVRYPLDFSRAVARFLDRVRPDVVGLLELEVWPNFTRACQERDIPVVVLNGRLSADSFQGYTRLRPVLAPSFRRLAGVAAQTRDYADRFEALGVPRDRIRVADSMKWEVPLPEGLDGAAAALGRALGVDPGRPTVAAVSTGPGEEARLLEGRPAGVQLVVVPRKPERFGEVAGLADWVRRSRTRDDGGAAGPSPVSGDPGAAPSSGPELFLVDTMGEAEAATALGDVVVVGRSFNGMGGSNPIPAARMGRPVVLGPDHQNFTEMVEALVEGGAALVAADPWPAVQALLDDPARRAAMAEAGPRTVAAHAGATELNVSLILDHLRRADRDPTALPRG